MAAFIAFLTKWGPIALHVIGPVLTLIGHSNTMAATTNPDVPSISQMPLLMAGIGSHGVALLVSSLVGMFRDRTPKATKLLADLSAELATTGNATALNDVATLIQKLGAKKP